ncbi:MAG: DedA family protein [Deferrisomatales bacterium]|nr:DedA family protein [Deferrisomatales bacterium]
MHLLGELITWIIETVGHLGYPGVFLLMALESSFFPFPSEVVMIPAGYLAHRGEMNLWAAVAAGTAGSMAGALVNYGLAVWLGRPFLERYGRFLFLPLEKLHRVEAFFRDHGEISTFIGRLITVVRQYISFPAGLARMPLGRFLFYTGLGAGIWVAILAAVGYVAAGNEELIRAYSREATLALLVFCAALLAFYVARHRRRKRRAASTGV